MVGTLMQREENITTFIWGWEPKMIKSKNELAPYQERVSEAAGRDAQSCPNVYMDSYQAR